MGKYLLLDINKFCKNYKVKNIRLDFARDSEALFSSLLSAIFDFVPKLTMPCYTTFWNGA